VLVRVLTEFELWQTDKEPLYTFHVYPIIVGEALTDVLIHDVESAKTSVTCIGDVQMTEGVTQAVKGLAKTSARLHVGLHPWISSEGNLASHNVADSKSSCDCKLA
jgi:hypothetical protein